MITEKEILEEVPSLYNWEYWPKGNFEEMQGFTMKSSDEEFHDAIKDLVAFIGRKGADFKVRKVDFMIKHTDLRKKEMLILTDDNLVGEGEIGVNWFHTRRGAKYSGTLQVSRRKGAEASHVKSFLVAIKYLLDGFLEKAFSQNILDSFVVSAGPKSKDVCTSCGYSYKTRLGETLHKCDNIRKCAHVGNV